MKERRLGERGASACKDSGKERHNIWQTVIICLNSGRSCHKGFKFFNMFAMIMLKIRVDSYILAQGPQAQQRELK